MDHQPLRTILTQTVNTPDQHHWISKLMGFDFEVVYRPGKDNKPANMLSRCDEGQFLSIVSVSKPAFGILGSLRRLLDEQTRAINLAQ